MSDIPTTPTATDKLEEVRKLSIEIASLTYAKEIADRAAKEAEAAADDARGRKAALDVALEALDGSMGDVAAEVREFVASCRNILQTVLSTMEGAAAQCNAIGVKVDELIADIAKLEAQKSALLDAIAKEAEWMSEKRADLDIYEQRIRAAAAVHLPQQKVDLPAKPL